MVEQLINGKLRENLRDGVMLLIFVGGAVAWATGFLSGNAVDRQAVAEIKQQVQAMATQQDVSILKTQISTLTTLVVRRTQKLQAQVARHHTELAEHTSDALANVPSGNPSSAP